MLIDRHRVARLMELSAAERTLKGPERLLREEDVAQLLRAAYDDASEKARADFMARVNQAPSTAWPWSAVQTTTPRSSGGGFIGQRAPVLTRPPAALILLLGQVDSPEADPANRLPDRMTPEGAAWAPLYNALHAWDTATVKKWWHPVGWVMPGAKVPDAQGMEVGDGAAPNGNTGVAPANGSGLPTQPGATTWTTERVALVAGATLVVTSVAVYSAVSLGRARELSRLSERLRAQEGGR